MTKKQKLGLNTSTTLTKSIAQVTQDVPVPDYAKFSETEVELWRRYTRVRPPDAWRDFDLGNIVKMVKLESKSLDLQAKAERMGELIKNDRGTPIVNPAMSLIDQLERRLLAIQRSMSINQTAGVDPRTMNAAGAKQNQYRAMIGDLADFIEPD